MPSVREANISPSVVSNRDMHHWDICFRSPWALKMSDYDAQLTRAATLFRQLGAVHVGEYGSRGVVGVSDLDLYVVFPDATANMGLAREVTGVVRMLDGRILQHDPFVMPLWASKTWRRFHPAPVTLPRLLGGNAQTVPGEDAAARRVFFAVEGTMDVMRRLQVHYERGRIDAFVLLASLNSLRQSIDVIGRDKGASQCELRRYARSVGAVREHLAGERSWATSSMQALARLGDEAPQVAVRTLEALGELGMASGLWGSGQVGGWVRLGDYRMFLSAGALTAVRGVYGDRPRDSISGTRAEIEHDRVAYAKWLRCNGFALPGMGRGVLKRSRQSRAAGLVRRRLRGRWRRPWLFDISVGMATDIGD
jgi:hypothetical protein